MERRLMFRQLFGVVGHLFFGETAEYSPSPIGWERAG